MMRQPLAVVGLILSLMIGFSVGFICGLSYGERGAYHLTYLSQRTHIEPILAGDPAYEDVRINEASAGHISLTGRIRSADAHTRLYQELKRLFGEPSAERLMDGVSFGRSDS